MYGEQVTTGARKAVSFVVQIKVPTQSIKG